MAHKSCKKCKIQKNEVDFYKDKSRLKSICKDCVKLKDKLRHKLNYSPAPKKTTCKVIDCADLRQKGVFCFTHYKEYKADSARKNRKPYIKKKILNCTNCNLVPIGHNSVYKLCRKCFNNSEVENDRIRAKKYYYNNKDKIFAKLKLKYQQDTEYRLSIVLRSRLNSAIKKSVKAGSAIKDLGCSIEQFKAYIESLFQPGMTWNNWGKGNNKWHIDHIRPISSFDLSDRDQLKKACHYTNLQPLWEVDNLIKGAKWHLKQI